MDHSINVKCHYSVHPMEGEVTMLHEMQVKSG